MFTAFLFSMLVGLGLAENVKTGSVEAFQKSLEQNGFNVQKG